jgi:putative hydrolase of the HAD superfamily
MATTITALFLDLGGVLLTNGWDRHMRERAIVQFHLQADREEIDERHHQAFDTYEEGKLSLDRYLDWAVFYKPRPFTMAEFRDFMFAQSQPDPAMIDLVRQLKARYQLRLVAVSNEGRELAQHRIEAFNLAAFIDFFIVSGFVHDRKPDPELYQLALDVAQVRRDQVVYLEDRPLFVEVAQGQGIRAIRHTGLATTRDALANLGLSLDGGTVGDAGVR